MDVTATYGNRATEQGDRVPLAVFDLDGTCISGQSGTLVTRYLWQHGYFGFPRALAIGWWGARYKLHLPYRQEEVRELMFAPLRTRDPHEIDKVMESFHDEVLLPRYRPAAIAEVARRKAEGCVTLLVSATYETIAAPAARHLGADAYLATKMSRDADGRYTGDVEGPVVAGYEKLNAVTDWADEHIGSGRWYLAAAYGDHHTDLPLLSAALEPAVVCPSHTLAREARRRAWPQLDWECA